MPSSLSDAKFIQNPLFRGMSAAEREELFGMMEVETFGPGETIQAEGESLQTLWILLKGQCRIIKRTKSGEEWDLSRLDSSGVFGEMSFFNPAPHSATVRTVTEVDLACLKRDKYDVLMRVGSSATQKLTLNTISVLIDRIRKMDDWIADRFAQNAASQHHEEWKEFQAKLYNGWSF